VTKEITKLTKFAILSFNALGKDIADQSQKTRRSICGKKQKEAKQTKPRSREM
jgi:hypothetical protein